MNKIFTVILSDEFSTSEVIKLFAGEFDNLEICQENDYSEAYKKLRIIKENQFYLQTYQLTSNKNLSLF